MFSKTGLWGKNPHYTAPQEIGQQNGWGLRDGFIFLWKNWCSMKNITLHLRKLVKERIGVNSVSWYFCEKIDVLWKTKLRKQSNVRLNCKMILSEQQGVQKTLICWPQENPHNKKTTGIWLQRRWSKLCELIS